MLEFETLSTERPTSNEELSAALATAERHYRLANPKSAALFQEACEYLPGGSTRATAFYPPFPLTLVKGDGPNLWDADGHEYLDFLGDYTAGVYGHDASMLDRIFDLIQKIGMSLSGPTEYEARLAKLICDRFPSCEQVRFCNSGTEANIFATALARQFTGRDTIMVFEGGYHGGALMFGGHDGSLNIQMSSVRAHFNDIEGTRAQIRRSAQKLAAVLVEPMMGSGGCIPSDPEFLRMLRQETEAHGIVLIFDEVMNSRLAPNGLQGFYGIRPDLTTLGKYLGGGFSFGAFGGRADILSLLDLRRESGVPHPGTFNNNISSMVGGTIGLTYYYTAEAGAEVNSRGDRLRCTINSTAERLSLPVFASGLGGVMNVHFCKGPIRNPTDIPDETTSPLRRLLHLHLLDDGFYTAPRGLITVSMAITEVHAESLAASIEHFLKTNANLIGKFAS